MSIIQYQQASYASNLQSQLETAGCERRVAAVVSHAVGELIDHISDVDAHIRRDIREDINETERQASRRSDDRRAGKRDILDNFIGATVFVMTAALVSGVLIALFR